MENIFKKFYCWNKKYYYLIRKFNFKIFKILFVNKKLMV